jgi:hypothetical protein
LAVSIEGFNGHGDLPICKCDPAFDRPRLPPSNLTDSQVGRPAGARVRFTDEATRGKRWARSNSSLTPISGYTTWSAPATRVKAGVSIKPRAPSPRSNGARHEVETAATLLADPGRLAAVGAGGVEVGHLGQDR